MDIAVILLLSFMLRALFVPIESSDSWVNLWLTKKCEKAGLGSHRAFNSLIPGFYGSSSLNHWIMSRLPERIRVAAGYVLNIAYDCLSILVFYFVARYLFLHVWPAQAAAGTVFTPHLAATLIYSTTPILLPVTSRVKGFGARTFGGLLVLLYLVLFAAGFLYGRPELYVGCVAVGITIILASQFAMQAMVFASIGLSICYLSVIPVSVLAATIAVGCIVPRLGIRRNLQWMADKYIWYARTGKNKPYIQERNAPGDIIRLPVDLFTRPARFFRLCFSGITPIIFLYNVPVLVWFIYWAAADAGSLKFMFEDGIAYYLFGIAASLAAVSVLTSFRPLMFLGQAERYFEYSASAISILFVLHALRIGAFPAATFWLFVAHLVLVLGSWSMLMRLELARYFAGAADAELDDVAGFLSAGPPARVVTIPVKIGHALAGRMADSEVKFYYDFICTGRPNGFRYMAEDQVFFSYIRPDFAAFRDKYGATTVVVRKAAVQSVKKHGIDYHLDGIAPIHEDSEYAVYDIGDLTREGPCDGKD